jgi:predicted HicB family RNase H-like nuclease
MAPVTVYLDKETKETIRAAAKAKNISVSQWVANLIRENLQPRRV